jgi:SAM-dependent methyltransferase
VPHLADQTYLLNEQYRDASNLNARIELHARFSTTTHNWHRWIFNHFDLSPNQHILEIGCGPGHLWQQNLDRLPAGWEITLIDLSPGMLDEARQTLKDHLSLFTFKQADAQVLPFDNATFDMVIANHMLYHVPDRNKAYAEIRRVSKPGGYFFAATNGEQHMAELRQIITPINPTAYEKSEPDVHFLLETGGAELAAYFSDVSCHLFDDALLVTELEPLVAYVRSGMRLTEAELEQFQSLAEEKMKAQGAIHITKSTGLFEAHSTP